MWWSDSTTFLIHAKTMTELLNFQNHSRYFKDCKYVYPVISRRSRGLSLGINLNLNNACNWRCVYCQVEGLIRGKPDAVDLDILEQELRLMLDWIVNGDFIQEFAPVELRRFNDICMAGNGEPTLSPQFVEVCHLIAKLRNEYKIADEVKTVLITNGSQLHIEAVQQGIGLLKPQNGEIWFKVDRVNPSSINQANQVNLSALSISDRLKVCGELCPTLIQSCWFMVDGIEPDKCEVEDFVQFVVAHRESIRGVLLYSVARNPALAEGQKVSSVSVDFLAEVAGRITRNSISCAYYQ